MKFTAKYFRDNYPEWKRKKDWAPTRYFYRQISFYLSAFFANLGWSANSVSFFSIIFGLAACASFIFGQPLFGAIFVNIWLMFDCADGNIARSVKKELFGDFADSMSSYICVGFLFVSIGYCVYQTGGFLVSAGDPWIILFGGFAGSCDSLMRLLYQKFLNSQYAQGLNASHSQDPEKESGINRLRMKIDGYLSLGGSIPIVLIVAAILNALDIVVFVWLCYYSLTFIASSVFLVRKTFIANKALTNNETVVCNEKK